MKPIEAHSTSQIKAKVTREEQAARELAHTSFSAGARVTLVVLFLTVILVVPLVQFLAAVRQPERVTRLLSGLRGLAPERAQVKSVNGPVSAINLLPEASRIKAVEDDWEQNSVVGESLLPRVQSLLLRLGQGNEKAYLGLDGWLFYRMDLDYVAGRPFLDPAVMKRRAQAGGSARPPQPDPLKAITDFRDRLAARGIQLIVMPMPVKPSVHPEHFSRRCPAGWGVLQNLSFSQFTNQLAKAGVAVFDPAPLLAAEKARLPGEALYLKTDTHWTPAAMERTATQLAAFARQQVALQPPQPQRYTAVEKSITAAGDVAMMLKLLPGRQAFPLETVQIRRVLDGGAPWRPVTASEVLFLGDSFANIYSLEAMGWGDAAGLAEQLSLALGLPVDALCRNDAGSFATREMLSRELRKGNDRLAGKKVVIWEFAARELASGDWRILPMDLGEASAAGFYVPAAGRAVDLRATVRAVSFVPKPGSVPYKDHILMLHVDGLIGGDDPFAAGREAVVFAWSMRDNKAMPASRLRPGDAVKLRLQPWSDVSAKYEKINRSELEGERMLLADPAWCGDWNGDVTSAAPGTNQVVNVVAGKAPAAAAGGNGSSFVELCAKKAADGETMAIPGSDGCIFLRAELRHIGVGRFWGDAATAVSRATSPDKADPLPAILDFHEQLAAMGIELIVAPVPCKALIYPDKLDGAVTGRLDAAHQEFLRLLGEKGVKTLDLAEEFLKAKADPAAPALYCKTDSHWSPYACEVTARRIRQLVGTPAWLAGRTQTLSTKEETRTITGDLTDGKGTESLPARAVQAPPASLEDKASPIVLLGDSHTLVFHAGAELHGTGAGLADQLAAELGLAVDVVGVRGSGATPARVNLIRRARADSAYLPGKKLVIWCFAAREFTESSGWSVLKLTR